MCPISNRSKPWSWTEIKHACIQPFYMMSSNGNIFRVTGPLWRESTGSPRKGQWHWALLFSLIYARTNGWANSRDAGDLRRHRAHYDVTAMTYAESKQVMSPMWSLLGQLYTGTISYCWQSLLVCYSFEDRVLLDLIYWQPAFKWFTVTCDKCLSSSNSRRTTCPICCVAWNELVAQDIW